MVDSFEAENDRFRVIRSDKIAFDTDAPSFQLFDTGRLQFTTTVTFPDLLSNLFYFSGEYSSIPVNQTYCESWSALYAQEWGPNEPDVSPTGGSTSSIQRNLPRTYLGSVPAGTNHLNIRARLRQTKSAPAFFGDEVPRVYMPYNQWINLIGGSCTCEGLGTSMKRHFDIVQIGNDIYLERYQSVNNLGVAFASSTNANARGWITNLASAGAASGAYDNAPIGLGIHAVRLDSKGPDATGSKRAPWASASSNACSTASDLDYESIYSVDLDIQPGRMLT